ncbi:MAG TPA: amino acid permease [Candidatus Thermoplasmatota archaeon]|nr:amino acid permease [Candidatus Thermoplasmatota archaeon]
MTELKKSFGLFDAFNVGIGAIIGAGIFIVTGIGASLAGPALLLSLLISAGIAAFTALSFAELSMRIPKEGGGYEFAHELVSPFAGFITGWLWLISNVVVGAVVSLGFAHYFALFVPIPVHITAVVACVLITTINYLGARDLEVVNNILVVFKLFVLACFIVIGIGAVRVGNITSSFFPHGGVGVLQGAAIMFFAFAGFARITIIGEEVRDPKKTIPRAIILALAVSTLVYVLVSYTAIGLVGYQGLANSGSPLADAARLEGNTAMLLIALGALAATFSVLLTTLLGTSRVSFAMSRNKDLPAFFAVLHPRRNIPYLAILIFGVTMTLFAAFTDLTSAVAISNFASLFYYAIANYAALKIKNPSIPRVVPIVGLLSCLLLLFFLTPIAWIVGCLGLGIGVAYFYGIRKRRKATITP